MSDDIDPEVHRAFESAARDDDGEDFIPWNDPRGKRWRRAIQSEARKRAKYKAVAKAAREEVETIKAERDTKISAMAELVEITSANYKALEERFKTLYVDHNLLLDKNRESAASSGGATPVENSEGAVSGSGALGTDPGDPEGESK